MAGKGVGLTAESIGRGRAEASSRLVAPPVNRGGWSMPRAVAAITPAPAVTLLRVYSWNLR
ncbi:hypothetical protein QF037_009266 [Streptomyces canus]|nr:hypothetical protein [Streptomyces canus]